MVAMVDTVDTVDTADMADMVDIVDMVVMVAIADKKLFSPWYTPYVDAALQWISFFFHWERPLNLNAINCA